MSAPKEIELKLACDASNLRILQGFPRLQEAAAKGWDQLESVYFDTLDRLLQRSGYVLRVRSTGSGYVQTAKADGDGLLERKEWEQAVAGLEPDRQALKQTPLAELLGKKTKLEPVFAMSIERSTYLVEEGSSRIEIALDQGTIKKPGAKRASERLFISEVELELKDGATADLFGLAREISTQVPVRLGVRSKSERGFALVDGEALRMRKAEPLLLSKDMTAADAFRAIAHGCLRHMRLNEDVLLDRRDPDALHQTRVAIRRLRSAFSLFGDLIADDQTERMRSELKRLSEPLGRARNLDVFLAKTLPAERARHPNEVGLLNLEKHLEAQRTEAYAAVLKSLKSDEWRRFLVELVAWINAGSWRSPEGKKASLQLHQPASMFAAAALEKRRRQVKKRGRDLATLSVEDRHQVRIAAKKLRYGAEFYASLYGGKKESKRHKAFVSALEKLQDSLGELNDIATGHELIEELSGSGISSDSAVFAAGQTSADIDAKTQKLLKSAAKAHEELIDVRPFWR